MLSKLSVCEIIAISTIYKDAAIAVKESRSPDAHMTRLLNILQNAHAGGRHSAPQHLYDALDSILHTDRAVYHLASTSQPISLALELDSLEPRPQRGKILELDLGL